MPYRIPSEEQVVKAIENCLVRNPRMRSQNELTAAVTKELQMDNPDYRVSGERIRHIGLKHRLFSISISYAHTEVVRIREKCPVCGRKLSSVRNMTLDGGFVELMRRCDMCGYVSKGGTDRPAMYSITRSVRGLDDHGRADMLRKAEALLNEAADLMDSALWMSGMEKRSNDDSKEIRRIASSLSYGGSLRNMARDLDFEDEEQPLWTMPLASPKYPDA